MKEIPLSRGLIALVDDEDFEALSAYPWYAHVSARGRTYAARKVVKPEARGDGERNTWTVEYMHHAIVGKPANGVIDHLSGDSLDNRRANLAPRTQSQNILNSALGRSKGVWHCKMTGRFAARASVAKRRHFLGRFDTEAEAIDAVAGFRAAHLPAQEGTDQPTNESKNNTLAK